MANDLKVGDVVELNSGGPYMTIESISPDASGKSVAYCVWFSHDEKKSAVFHPEALKKSQPH